VKLVAATVVRIVDGDTAVFRLADGTQEKVRFIGVDTPESTTRIEPYGKAAAAYTAKRLKVGSRVYLEKDVEPRDRYGRLLAYVWLTPPSSITEMELRAKLFNAMLAADGYAQQMTIAPNVKYAEYFRTFVQKARAANEGLWAGEESSDSGTGGNTGVGAATVVPTAPGPSTSGAAYIGNRNSMKFHIPSCSSVGDMNPSNKVALSSRDKAVSGGYVPCKRCRP
jgi:micrococcal nuclease